MSSIKIGISAINIKGNAGSVRIILSQIEYLSKNGFEVHCFAQKINKDEIIKIGGIPHKIPRIFRRGHKARILFSFLSKLFMKANGIELVIGHGDNLVQDILCLHNCVELAHEKVYGQNLSKKNSVLKMHYSQLLDKNLKVIIANSKLMKNDLISRYGINKEKIEVVYPGYNIKKFNYEEKIKVGTFKIGFITSGDLVKRGVYNFIDAIEVFIKKHNFDMKVIIIGKAGKMIKELKKIISNKQLENIIEFIESNDKIEEYYKNIDLMVHPALFEEFGLVVQEAIVCGTPVLTSKMVGASELLEMGDENIFLMENSSKDEIIKGLEYFLLDADNLKE